MKLTKLNILGGVVAIFVFIAVKLALGALTEPLSKMYSRDETIALINTTVAKDMYVSLLAYFPTDAENLIDKFQSTLNTAKTQKEASAEIFEYTSAIRIKYAPFLAKAPDTTLKEILTFQTGLHQVFLDRPLVCNALLMQGAAGLSPADRELLTNLPQFPEGTRLQFKAMAQGRDNPVERDAVTDDTYDSVFDKMIEDGLPEEQFADFETPDLNSPSLCANFISLFEHVRDAEVEGAAALRAQFVSDMFSE
jgi:hypothetical protein